MLLRLALAVLALAAPCGLAAAQTLHLISVADSQDEVVGPAFARSAARINDKMKSISGLANLHFDLVFIDGNKRKYSCAEIAKAIKDVRVDPDDVVVFYHSGHGQSARRSATDRNFSRFPALQCSASTREKIPRLEDISNDLRKKKARLVITVADSCNNFVGPKQMEQVASKMLAEQIAAMYRHHKGHVLMASSRPGEFSFYEGGNEGIGKFTARFVNVFNVSPPPEVDDDALWTYAKGVLEREIAGQADGVAQTSQHPEIETATVYDPPPTVVASRSVTRSAAPAVRPAPAPNRTASPPIFRVLRKGDTGDEVKSLQQALTAAGYAQVKIDGVYGESTVLAVKDLQKKSGFQIDGSAGSETLSKLGL